MATTTIADWPDIIKQVEDLGCSFNDLNQPYIGTTTKCYYNFIMACKCKVPVKKTLKGVLESNFRHFCQKCWNKSTKIPYEERVKKLKDRGCSFICTEQEYYDNLDSNKNFLFNITMSCGHNHSTNFVNFDNSKTTDLCKKCNNFEDSKRKKARAAEFLKNGLGVPINVHLENIGCDYLKLVHKPVFEIRKTDEGCLGDYMYKPLNVTEDKWLLVQLKTTSQANKQGGYKFSLNNTKYDNCIMIFMCLNYENDKVNNPLIWTCKYFVLEKEKEEDKQTQSSKKKEGTDTSVEISSTGKYVQYAIDNKDNFKALNDKLLDYYYKDTEHLKKFSAKECCLPKSKTQQNEAKYRDIREDQIHFLLSKRQSDSSKIDFIANGKKFQEKVASVVSNNAYRVGFGCYKKMTHGKKTWRRYKTGENDYYWIWIPNTTFFYLFSDKIMVDNDLIDKSDDITKHDSSDNSERSSIVLRPNPTKKNINDPRINSLWANKYLFDYDHPDFKVKLLDHLQIEKTNVRTI